jgi:hypothetical protein
MKLPSISPIRFGRGTCFPARDAESRGAIASDRNYVHRMSNFVFQLIRSRTARQITGDRNNYTETTPTESAYSIDAGWASRWPGPGRQVSNLKSLENHASGSNRRHRDCDCRHNRRSPAGGDSAAARRRPAGESDFGPVAGPVDAAESRSHWQIPVTDFNPPELHSLQTAGAGQPFFSFRTRSYFVNW